MSALPSPTSGLLPTPGMNQAQDIGGGMARTPYGPTGSVFLDWRIPQIGRRPGRVQAAGPQPQHSEIVTVTDTLL